MKKSILISFLIILLNNLIYSQQNKTIRGKLYYSENFKNQFQNIYVSEKNSKIKVKANEDGTFELKTAENKKEDYLLLFYVDTIKIKEYILNKSYADKERVKSISICGECEININTARKDWKNNNSKIYIYQKFIDEKSLSRKDKRIEIKYKFKYVFFNDNIKDYDCYLKYNERIILSLKITNHQNIMKKIRNDYVGR